MKDGQVQFHTLTGYQIGHVVGQGKWGTVKLLTSGVENNQSEYVIKLVDDHKNQRQRLLDEFKIVSRFGRSKGYREIVKYHKLFECPQTHQLGLSMEYLVGCSIRDVTCNHSQLQTYLIQLLKVICDLHNQNIVHRDIKCDNIIIVNNGQQLKLIDFNLSVSLSVNPNAGFLLGGTPKHYSPELICWKDIRETFKHPSKLINVLKKADIWAIGLMFYKLISQKPAFNGQNSNEIHEMVLQRRLILLPEDSIMNHIVNLCLTHDYHLRPSAYTLHQLMFEDINPHSCNLM